MLGKHDQPSRWPDGPGGVAFAIVGVIFLGLAMRLFFVDSIPSGLYALAFSSFCFGSSFDPNNIIRTALLGRVDLRDGETHLGVVGRALLWLAAAIGATAIVYVYSTTGRLP